jgi:hypothetical protein
VQRVLCERNREHGEHLKMVDQVRRMLTMGVVVGCLGTHADYDYGGGGRVLGDAC